jgi:hypothetical protein
MVDSRDVSSDYECKRVAKTVVIYVRVFLNPAGSPPAMSPQRCSGMPICQLFPSGKFPPAVHELQRATGCPYMESLTIGGT